MYRKKGMKLEWMRFWLWKRIAELQKRIVFGLKGFFFSSFFHFSSFSSFSFGRRLCGIAEFQASPGSHNGNPFHLIVEIELISATFLETTSVGASVCWYIFCQICQNAELRFSFAELWPNMSRQGDIVLNRTQKYLRKAP